MSCGYSISVFITDQYIESMNMVCHEWGWAWCDGLVDWWEKFQDFHLQPVQEVLLYSVTGLFQSFYSGEGFFTFSEFNLILPWPSGLHSW